MTAEETQRQCHVSGLRVLHTNLSRHVPRFSLLAELGKCVPGSDGCLGCVSFVYIYIYTYSYIDMGVQRIEQTVLVPEGTAAPLHRQTRLSSNSERG